MSTTPENPPAFPTNVPPPWAQGMSMRDWFAGQALAGTLASSGDTEQFRVLSIGAASRKVPFARHIADMSFEIADAMLVARAKQEPTP